MRELSQWEPVWAVLVDDNNNCNNNPLWVDGKADGYTVAEA
jgi:hypothetical protein